MREKYAEGYILGGGGARLSAAAAAAAGVLEKGRRKIRT